MQRLPRITNSTLTLILTLPFVSCLNLSVGASEIITRKVTLYGAEMSDNGLTVASEGILWLPKINELISLPRNFYSSGVSPDGGIVFGNGTAQPGGDRVPYTWTSADGLTEIPIGGTGDVAISDASSDLSVFVGNLANSSTNGYPRPFLWSEKSGLVQIPLLAGDVWGQFTKISGDGSVIAGGHGPDYIYKAFRWTESTGTEDLGSLPDRTDHRVSDLSHDGSVIVGTGWRECLNTETNDNHETDHQAFRWTEETGMVSLGAYPGGGLTESRATSKDGSLVVGHVFNVTNTPRPERRELFAWTETFGMTSLSEIILDEVGVQLPAISVVFDISADEKAIVGRSRGPTDGFPTNDLYTWAIYFDEPLSDLIAARSVLGDYDADGTVTVGDIGILQEAIRAVSLEPRFDLDSSGATDLGDLQFMIRDILGTWMGDSNLDGEFNSGDLVGVFQAGQYEDAIVGNSTWETGDWDSDREFTTSDLVAAFQDGGFEQGPRAAVNAVPEPSGLFLVYTAAFYLADQARRRHRRVIR